MSTSRSTHIFAPGKVMLTGEYAVLAGAPALAMGIDKGVHLFSKRGEERLVRQAFDRSPESVTAGEAHTIYHAFRVSVFSGLSILMDVSELYHPELRVKLGLGSSGAEAAALLRLAAGEDWGDPVERIRELMRITATKGSGADFSASVLGGVQRHSLTEGRVDVSPVGWTPLPMAMVFTGVSSPTRHRLARFEEAASGSGTSFRRALDELRQAANRDADGFPSDPLTTIDASGRALEAFLAAFDPEAISPAMGQIRPVAERLGGAAKISGAGGGDCVLAMFREAGALQEFIVEMDFAGLSAFEVKVSDKGVRSIAANE